MKTGPKPQPVNARFWSHVNKNGPVPANKPGLGPCWVWTGSVNKRGYATFTVVRTPRLRLGAHRYAYEETNGPIPDGLTLDHLCLNTSCVRPGHLEPVPLATNIQRGTNATKTHCANGHEFTPGNTMRPGAVGWRKCRVCVVAREKARGPRQYSAEAIARGRERSRLYQRRRRAHLALLSKQA